jgi:hypothetical protein
LRLSPLAMWPQIGILYQPHMWLTLH